MAAAENSGESNKVLVMGKIERLTKGASLILGSRSGNESRFLSSSLPSSLPSLMLYLPYSSSSNASLLSLRLVFPFAFNATQYLIYYPHLTFRPSP
ncbi:hypothetical protein Gohar_010556 [Gossypium harknessii]|uniref:Uncharacterized protein n=1 Tax=Gossypium harknessii TaxID=34285 RepID=A0A7J9GR84_9ROSI|nr:hypothetical protein [Gossypium harknessii]